MNHGTKKMALSGEGGYSLVEIMTVVAIIAILVAIGTLSTQSMMNRSAAERTTKELYTDLQNAQVRAMHRNRIHFVTLTATEYSVVEDSSPAPDGNGTLEIADSTILQKKIDPRYPLVWTGPTSSFAVSTRGMIASAQTGTVHINIPVSESGEYDCIRVSELKSTMGKWNGTNCIVR